jgi:hypothetical protein
MSLFILVAIKCYIYMLSSVFELYNVMFSEFGYIYIHCISTISRSMNMTRKRVSLTSGQR